MDAKGVWGTSGGGWGHKMRWPLGRKQCVYEFGISRWTAIQSSFCVSFKVKIGQSLRKKTKSFSKIGEIFEIEKITDCFITVRKTKLIKK